MRPPPCSSLAPASSPLPPAPLPTQSVARSSSRPLGPGSTAPTGGSGPRGLDVLQSHRASCSLLPGSGSFCLLFPSSPPPNGQGGMRGHHTCCQLPGASHLGGGLSAGTTAPHSLSPSLTLGQQPSDTSLQGGDTRSLWVHLDLGAELDRAHPAPAAPRPLAESAESCLQTPGPLGSSLHLEP